MKAVEAEDKQPQPRSEKATGESGPSGAVDEEIKKEAEEEAGEAAATGGVPEKTGGDLEKEATKEADKIADEDQSFSGENKAKQVLATKRKIEKMEMRLLKEAKSKEDKAEVVEKARKLRAQLDNATETSGGSEE